MRPFTIFCAALFSFFFLQKWGKIMFHQWDIEMLSIIGYLLHNGGLA
jgi:hypothetical protein